MQPGPVRFGRRQAIRTAAAVGLGALGAGLAACGPQSPSAATAAPTPGSQTTPLSFEPLNSGLWSGQGSTIVHQALWETLQPWREKNPGIALTMQPFGGDTDTLAILSGNAPDVILAWQNFGALSGAGLLLDITEYVRSANRDLTVFPPYAVDSYKVGGKLYALPFYVATTAMVVNEAILDDVGLDYPAPGAALADWVTLWRSLTIKTGSKVRTGGAIKQTEVGLPQSYFRGFGASIMDPADPTHCTLDSEAAIAAASTLLPLVTEGTCVWDYGIGDLTNGFAGGRYATAVLWNAALAITSLDLMLSKMQKWNFYGMPVLPKGDFASTQYDYRAISASTKNPDAAYSLLDWLSFEPDFQRTLMHYGLEPPALTSLQDEYTTIMAQTIPPFVGKNLGVLTQYIKANGAIMDPIFPYNEPQAQSALVAGEQAIINGTDDPRLGMTQLAQQISALEQAGAKTANVQGAESKAFPVKGLPMATVPLGL